MRRERARPQLGREVAVRDDREAATLERRLEPGGVEQRG